MTVTMPLRVDVHSCDRCKQLVSITVWSITPNTCNHWDFILYGGKMGGNYAGKFCLCIDCGGGADVIALSRSSEVVSTMADGKEITT